MRIPELQDTVTVLARSMLSKSVFFLFVGPPSNKRTIDWSTDVTLTWISISKRGKERICHIFFLTLPMLFNASAECVRACVHACAGALQSTKCLRNDNICATFTKKKGQRVILSLRIILNFGSFLTSCNKKRVELFQRGRIKAAWL